MSYIFSKWYKLDVVNDRRMLKLQGALKLIQKTAIDRSNQTYHD